MTSQGFVVNDSPYLAYFWGKFLPIKSMKVKRKGSFLYSTPMEMMIKLTTSGEQFGKNQVEKCAKKMDKLESRKKLNCIDF